MFERGSYSKFNDKIKPILDIPSVEDVEAFEKEIGGVFPLDYRQFILAVNGGQLLNEMILKINPTNKKFIRLDDVDQNYVNSFTEEPISILYFFGLSNSSDQSNTINLRWYNDIHLPSELYPIADQAYTDNCFCINKNPDDPNYGKIYFAIFGEAIEGSDDQDPDYENILFVNDSFTGFVSSLKEVV